MAGLEDKRYFMPVSPRELIIEGERRGGNGNKFPPTDIANPDFKWGEIRLAEQEIRDLEAGYKNTIALSRTKIDLWNSEINTQRKKPFVGLGEIGGVELIEVGVEEGFKNIPDSLAKKCAYNGQDYSWLTSVLPRLYGWSSMKRAIRLNNEGFPHVFGIAQKGEYSPTEIGIFVPSNSLVASRRRHEGEILKDYPTVAVSLEEIRRLNLSPDFTYRIEAQIDVPAVSSKNLLRRDVTVKPVVDGTNYCYGKKLGFPAQVTEFYIDDLEAPRINLGDFAQGRKHPILEKIRTTIGAAAYQQTAGNEEGPSDYMFRFDRLLTPKEIADALEQLGNPQNSPYHVTLHRLNEKLRELVNLPLHRATPSPRAKSYEHYMA